MSFGSLKYEDHKNEDCWLTYPNLTEKRKQIDVISGIRTRHITLYKCQQIQQVVSSTARKVLVEKWSIAMFSL